MLCCFSAFVYFVALAVVFSVVVFVDVYAAFIYDSCRCFVFVVVVSDVVIVVLLVVLSLFRCCLH